MGRKRVLLEVKMSMSDDLDSHEGRKAIWNAAKAPESPSKGIEQIGKSAWLIDLHTHAPVLCKISSIADTHAWPYRLLFLEQESEWTINGEWK